MVLGAVWRCKVVVGVGVGGSVWCVVWSRRWQQVAIAGCLY